MPLVRQVTGNGMTAIGSSSTTLNQQLYMRLFDRLNTDKDDALTVGEIGAIGDEKFDSASVFKLLDADADGRVTRQEMTPPASLGADSLAALIAAQTQGPEAETDEDVVAALFERADLDGDGALSASEMKAETDLRRAGNLDAGYAAGPVVMALDRNDDGLLTKDEVQVARPIPLPADAVRFFDELPENVQQGLTQMRDLMGLPKVEIMNPEEKQAARDRWAADAAERASGPDGTRKFLEREIEGLRTYARADFDTAAMTNDLSRRLLQQVLGDGWAKGVAA